jgi:hypothetical protein
MIERPCRSVQERTHTRVVSVRQRMEFACVRGWTLILWFGHTRSFVGINGATFADDAMTRAMPAPLVLAGKAAAAT